MSVSGASDLPPTTQSNNADWCEPAFFPVDENGNAFSLKGKTVLMQLRAGDGTGRAVLDCETPNRGIVLTPNELGFVIGPAAAVMQTIPPGDYDRDVLILDGPLTIYGGRGPVTIVQGITRR